MSKAHIPVLLNEIIEFLNLNSGDNVIDCTLGAGGHSKEILKKIAPKGQLLAIDLDADAIKIARKNLKDFSKRVIFVKENFSNLKKIIKKYNFKKVQAVLMDLGISSLQIDQSNRGFSFLKDEFLDMRFNQAQVKTAENVLNHYAYNNLIRIFADYGDFNKKKAKMLAQAIIIKRRRQILRTTFDFRDIITDIFSYHPKDEQELKRKKRNKEEKLSKTKINLVARAFQALRIEVNAELDLLREALPQALEILEPGGRIAVISFHSGEDRVVKNFFRDKARKCVCPQSQWVCSCKRQPAVKVLTKKPLTASEMEIQQNSRARSAKMRVIEKF